MGRTSGGLTPPQIPIPDRKQPTTIRDLDERVSSAVPVALSRHVQGDDATAHPSNGLVPVARPYWCAKVEIGGGHCGGFVSASRSTM